MAKAFLEAQAATDARRRAEADAANLRAAVASSRGLAARASAAEARAMAATTDLRAATRGFAASRAACAAAVARAAALEGGVDAARAAAAAAARDATRREERLATKRLVADVAAALRAANVDRGLFRLKAALRRHHLAVLAAGVAALRGAARRRVRSPRSRAADFLPASPRVADAIRRQGTTIPSYY